MKLNIVIFLLFVLSKHTEALSCMIGQSGLSVVQDCPISNSSVKCAAATYTIAGLTKTLRQGCLENCANGNLVPIEGLGLSAVIECCEENFCNHSNNFVQNTATRNICLVLLSLLVLFFNF